MKKMNEYELAEEVAKRLTIRTRLLVSGRNYLGWLNGETGYAKFDKVVKSFLGKENYDKFDSAGRLNAKLLYELRLGDRVSCGVDLKS